jgi:hypothetical protein
VDRIVGITGREGDRAQNGQSEGECYNYLLFVVTGLRSDYSRSYARLFYTRRALWME